MPLFFHVFFFCVFFFFENKRVVIVGGLNPVTPVLSMCACVPAAQ